MPHLYLGESVQRPQGLLAALIVARKPGLISLAWFLLNKKTYIRPFIANDGPCSSIFFEAKMIILNHLKVGAKYLAVYCATVGHETTLAPKDTHQPGKPLQLQAAKLVILGSASHGYYHRFSSLITPKTNNEIPEILWLTFIWRISENLGVKHVLPIFLDIIRSSVKSIHKLPTTKAPNAALNGHDGEDIPGYRALTRHHISTPEKAAGDFQSWNIHGNIMNLWMEE